MKTTTEKQADYIASRRIAINKKMTDIAKLIIQNTVNNPDRNKAYAIELSIGSSMGGIGINIYKGNDGIENADCYGVYWPFENVMFFNKERFDNDVNDKIKQLDVIFKMAKKYSDLNNNL